MLDSCSGLGQKTPQQHIFDLEKVFDAVLGALPADAGLLHAAERRDLGRDDSLVDADDSVFERLGNAHDAADVARIEIGGETVFGGVGDADWFRLILEAEERRDGPEDFLARDLHAFADIGHYGWLEERPA